MINIAILSLLLVPSVSEANFEARIGQNQVFHICESLKEWDVNLGEWVEWYRYVTIEVVELRHLLPGKVVGWEYVGIVRTETIAHPKEVLPSIIWWGSVCGGSGVAESKEAAVKAIMRCAGKVAE